MAKLSQLLWLISFLLAVFTTTIAQPQSQSQSQSPLLPRALPSPRQRLSLNAAWRFARFTDSSVDDLAYNTTLKPWILPSANGFLLNGTQWERPGGEAPRSVYTERGFEEDGEEGWEEVGVPHDWGVKGRKSGLVFFCLFVAMLGVVVWCVLR